MAGGAQGAQGGWGMWWWSAVPKGMWGGQWCPWDTGVVREVQRDKVWLVVPRGTPVVPRGSWGGCRWPRNVVVASSDQGYTGMARGCGQQWPAMLRGAGNSQGGHEDVVRGWQCPRGHGCLGKTWSHWHHPGALGVAGTLLRGQGSPPDHPPMPAGGAAGLAAGAERGQDRKSVV